MRTIRLYVDDDLTGGAVDLGRRPAHYLLNVLRLSTGGTVHLFNGRDGEWRGEIIEAGRAHASVALRERVREQRAGPDVWLAFAPVKRGRIDLIAEKATELGVAALLPVMTENTAVSRVNTERLRANAVEAAEQCGRLTIPDVRQPEGLADLLRGWPGARRLIVCDETGRGAPVVEALQDLKKTARAESWGILTGPEGGFSPSELDLMAEYSIVTRVGLGPRILRADTAAIAALVCWQTVLGDWTGM